MPFAPAYITHVLNENFEDAKALFLSPLMAIHYAHLVMLAECQIVSRADARQLRDALDSIVLEDVRRATYDGTFEDLFFYVDRLIVEACGEEVAGRLHTARSRNDIDMTMYRMRQREFILGLIAASQELRRALIAIAARHHETVLPAHTHTQPAQPTTVAHYLLAVVEQLERDATRLRAAYLSTNCCPLGACAITGTGFPIDRARTSDLLGFAAPTGNTYGSIATVDYLLESTSAAAVLLVGLGRFVQDLLLWCTAEFAYLRLGEGFVQASSIMPQKRNPVALEHARAIGSKAFGQALAVLTSVHNTPFGDVVDTQDDLQPLVFSMFRDAIRTVKLVAASVEGADFNVPRLEERARAGWITLTELADTLTREHDLSFRSGHAIAARFVAERERDPEVPLADVLQRASTAVLGVPIRYENHEIEDILSPRHFVDVRKTPGGPAPSETTAARHEAQARLARDETWWIGARDALAAAEWRLREWSERL